MALLRQIERCRPTAIAVPTEHGNLHETSSEFTDRKNVYGNCSHKWLLRLHGSRNEKMREFDTSTVDFFFYLYSAGFASWFFRRACKECKAEIAGRTALARPTVRDWTLRPFPADGS